MRTVGLSSASVHSLAVVRLQHRRDQLAHDRKATYDNPAFRYLSADQHPDHDTIASFRQEHQEALAGLFVQDEHFCKGQNTESLPEELAQAQSRDPYVFSPCHDAEKYLDKNSISLSGAAPIVSNMTMPRQPVSVTLLRKALQ